LYEVDYKKLDNNTLLIAFVAAYVIGHIIQPIPSWIINAYYQKYNGGLYPRTEPTISKSYAETVSALSSAILTIVILIAYIGFYKDTKSHKIIICILFIFFFIATTQLKAYATNRKIINYKKGLIGENTDIPVKKV